MVKYDKFILVNISTDEEKQYKTLRDIAKDLDLEYSIIKTLHNHSKTNKKYLHSFNKILFEKYKIIDIVRII